MDIIINARRRLQLSVDRAYLGKEDGTLRNSDGLYYVRPILSTGNAPAIPLPLRAGLSLTPRLNLVVELGWSKTGQREIVGPNLAATQSQGINIAVLNPGDPASAGLLQKEQLGELYCRAHPGKVGFAQVFPGRVFFGNGFAEYAGGEIDLNSYKPAASNHRYIGVFLMPDGTLTAAASTTQADSAALDSTDVQEARNAASANSLPIRVIRWDGDDSDLDDSAYDANSNPNGARDLRNLWSPVPISGSFAIVRAATTANITLSGAQTIDGVSVVAGDKVLVKAQNNTTQHGIYTAASGAWARSEDRIQAAMLVSVQEGTLAADTIWILITNEVIVVGTTSLSFARVDARGIQSVTLGGTGSDLSASGPGHLVQLSAGSVLTVRLDKLNGTTAPTVNEDSGDGYAIGSRWYDTTNDKEYVALDVTVGAAVWKETTIVSVRKTLFDHFADATVGGAEADIYSDTLVASQLAANGDKIVAVYAGNFVTLGTELTHLKQYFDGQVIWDSTGIAPATGTTSWRVNVEIIRVSATVIRYSVSLNTTGASGYVYCTVGELTGRTLSNTNIVKLTGASSGVGSGSGDIIGKLSTLEFVPAA